MISYPYENVIMFKTPSLRHDYLHLPKRMEEAFNSYYDNDETYRDYSKLVNPETISRKKFTPEEDNELIKQAKIFGARKWDLIAKYIPNRTAKQCRDRYKNYLSPNIFHGEWSNEEDIIILEKIKELGPQWSTIASILKNRTSNSVKNRAKYLIKNKFNPTSATSSTLSLKNQDKNESSSDEQLQKISFDCEKSICSSDSPSDNSSDIVINSSSETSPEISFEKMPKMTNSGFLFPPIPNEYHVSFQEILA